MAEKENIEYKSGWRDEYLKWICALANQEGGTLFIGLDDNGEPTGLGNPKKLMEDIPNKIQNYFGLVPNVEYNEEQNFITVYVSASPTPLTYKGKFYVRSGSTMKTLESSELQRFFFQKGDTGWDAISEEGFTFDDLDEATIKHFINLVSKRFPSEGAKLESVDLKELLEKLHLVKDGKYKRAAILLFGKDPQAFFPNAYLKIGKFTSDTNVQTQDEIRGNLFHQLEQALEILKSKYLETRTTYEGLQRIEDLIYPEPALREALVNALIHKDYTGPHIQIKVFNESMTIWNYGKLPSELTFKQLKESHPSFPRNELLANMFFKAGYIEAWGRGTLEIAKEVSKAGLPEPDFEELTGGIALTFFQPTAPYLAEEVDLNERQKQVIEYLKENDTISRLEYANMFNVSRNTALNDLNELIRKNVVNKTGKTNRSRYSLK